MKHGNPKSRPTKALLIVKETLKEKIERSDDPELKSLLEDGNPERESILRTHSTHIETLSQVVDELSDRNITSRCVYRGSQDRLEHEDELLITIGGDGTFIDASHDILTPSPVLGINSAPQTSHGHFCIATAENIGNTLDRVLDGSLLPSRLLRLELRLDGKELPVPPILNEVLIAHANPAGTSRYSVELSDAKEPHKSSGFIVSTPSGSTGFLRSEGGEVRPLTERSLSFLVRAPFTAPRQVLHLARGRISESEELVITSQMTMGNLYIDGAHIIHPFPRGSQLTIRPHSQDLLAYVNPSCHDIYRED